MKPGCQAQKILNSQFILYQLHPIRRAQRQNFIVKIVVRIVQQAITLRAAVADPDVAAGFLLQHEGEVFCAHAGSRCGVDALFTGNGDGGADGAGGFFRAVDSHRITGVFGVEQDVGVNSKTLRDALRQLTDALFQLLAHGIFEAAEGATDDGGIRQCVPGVAAVYLRNADHRGIGGIDPAANDGLQLRDQMRRSDQHIVAKMRHGGMSGLAF